MVTIAKKDSNYYEIRNNISNLINSLRNHEDISLTELGKISGLGYARVRRIISVNDFDIRLNDLVKLAEAFKKTLSIKLVYRSKSRRKKYSI